MQMCYVQLVMRMCQLFQQKKWKELDRLGSFVWFLCYRCFALVLCIWYSLCHIIILGLVWFRISG